MDDYPELEVDDVMPFGKFKGILIGEIIEDEPDYIVWIGNKGYVEFSEEVYHVLDRKIKEKK